MPLKGLNIRQSRGRWYVSPRAGGEAIVKGFEGTRADLMKHLGTLDVLELYQASRRKASRPREYAPNTLGALVKLYTDDGNDRWARLAPKSRADYEKVLAWLKPEFVQPLELIDAAAIYDVQAKAVREKWPRFADTMVSLLSAMFTMAVKRRMMPANPAMGIERVQKNDPNANREWRAEEFEIAIKAAELHIRTPLMIARFMGYRGQTLAALQWSQYADLAPHGRVITIKAAKNDEAYWLPVDARLKTYLDGLTKTSTWMCTNSDGRPWKNERSMQNAVSRFLRDLEAKGKVGRGLTLHGLRVTFAAALKRERGASDKDVATALGDRSERMGGHYTRHVEKEATIIRLFSQKAAG